MRDDEVANAQGAIGALVLRAVDGDEQATHDLLAHVHPLALRYCRTRLSRLPGDARHFVEDLAQEVCVAVLLALPRYKDTGRPFEAFVFAIAAHNDNGHTQDSTIMAVSTPSLCWSEEWSLAAC